MAQRDSSLDVIKKGLRISKKVIKVIDFGIIYTPDGQKKGYVYKVIDLS